VPQPRGHGKVVKTRTRERAAVVLPPFGEFLGTSFRGYAKHRTRKFEIPGLVLTHHPGMTVNQLRTSAAIIPANVSTSPMISIGTRLLPE
jgi:hypothetical protein